MAKKQETALVKFPNLKDFAVVNVPPKMAALLAENTGGRKLTAFDLDRIKFPSGGGLAWEVPTMEGEPDINREIAAIIIAKRRGRVYYDAPFDGQSNPPTCFSEDGITGIGEPGGQCAVCPLNEFGSDSGGGKACSEREVLFLLRRQDAIPIVLSVPSTSLRGLNKYFLRLTSHGRPFWRVESTIGLENTKNKSGIEFSRLKITTGAILTPDEVARVGEIAIQMREIFTSTPIATPANA